MAIVRSLWIRSALLALLALGGTTGLRAVDITSVSPTEVSTAGGDTIRVLGSDFDAALHRLMVGGRPAEGVVFESSRVIDARTPALAAGDHELWLEMARGGARVATYRGAITAVAPPSGPRILSVRPDSVPADGGEAITLIGEGLTPDLVLRIGGERVSDPRFVSEREIAGLSPALPPGVYAASLWEDAGAVPVLVARLGDAVEVVGPTARQTALSELQRLSSKPLRVQSYGPFARFVAGRVPVAGRTRLEQAGDFLARFGRDLYDQTDERLELHLYRQRGSEESRAPGESVLLYQTFDGLLVHGAGIQIGLNGEEVTLVAAKLLPAPVLADLATDSEVSAAEAEAIAAQAFDVLELDDAPEDVSPRVLGETRLVVYAAGLLLDSDELAPRIAWRVQVARGGAFQFFVDAITGDILNAATMEEGGGDPLHMYDLDTRDALDMFQTPDDCLVWPALPHVGSEAGIALAYVNDAEATAALLSFQDTYRFYHEKFQLHSFNAIGAQIDVWLHSARKNATWNPTCGQIQFGTGWVSRDIVGHEFTHAVIQYSSGLIYEFQSGALNESFADIMGESIDQVNGNTSWLLGDNRVGGANALRDMQNPGIDHISEIDYRKVCVTAGGMTFCTYEDNGGVHSNSGIPNYTAFLMAQGGTHPDTNIDVQGMGLAKMYRLKFAAMVTLPYFSDFNIAAGTEIGIAEDWAQVGNHGFNSEDVCTVRNAWAAVGIGIVISGCEQSPGTPPDPFDPDGDGVPSGIDNCANVANPDQADSDLDNIGDACDDSIDADHDGFGDDVDTCPGAYNPDQGPCDDLDGDGVLNGDDNCTLDPNPGQEDTDGDGYGDACQSDVDGDEVFHLTDNCPVVFNPDQEDADGDGYGDACDLCPNTFDGTYAFKTNGQPYQPDSDGDGVPDTCDSSILIGGVLPGALDLITDGRSRRIQVQSRPGSVQRLPLPFPWPPEEATARNRLAVTLDGLDPTVLARVVDDEGVVVSPGTEDGVQRNLRFEVLGGKRYFLDFEFGPEHPVDDVVEFDFALFTQDDLPTPPTFRRGDINGDSGVNVTDAVALLEALFRGSSELGCLDASDANDDGSIDVSDALAIVFHLFREGDPLPDPGDQACGFDTGETLGCELQPGCE